MSDKTTKTWGVMAVDNGMFPVREMGAARISNPHVDLRRALDVGWEPFAVADGYIWLKKLGERNADV